MGDISLSKAVRSNLLSLQNTASLMAKTQERLSTGNKVNSALDNPTNFFTAAGLNSRASDLNQLMDSMANGIQTLEAADNGLTAITKTLESMQSTLRQARQDKSFQTSSLVLADIDPNNENLGKLTLSGGAVGNPKTIDLTKSGTGAKVEFGAAFVTPEAATKASITGAVTVADADVQAATAFSIDFDGTSINISVGADTQDTPDRTVDDYVDLVQEQIDASALGGKLTVSNNGGKLTIETVDTVDGEITVGGTDADGLFGDSSDAANTPASVTGSDGKYSFLINNKEITIEAGDNIDDAIASMNEQLGDKSKFEVYKEVGNKIAIRATSADAGTLTIGGDDAGLFGTVNSSADLTFARSVDEMVSAVNTALEGKVRASNDNGKLRLENLSTEALDVEGLDANGAINGGASKSSIAGNSVRAGLADQFNELRDQLDKLADDASFNGINLLRGDKLTITFNETGTSSIDIQTKGEKQVNANNLGVSTTLKAQDLDTDSNIDKELDKLKLALNSVRSQSSAFGSNLSIVQNRQDFTKNMINTLQTGGANLTLADMNEEAANLLALQTRQSLSSSSLSLASQADQSVLQLIR